MISVFPEIVWGFLQALTMISLWLLWAKHRETDEFIRHHSHPNLSPRDHDHDHKYQEKTFESHPTMRDLSQMLDQFKLEWELEREKEKNKNG